MKTRPILFSGPMVRALLAGRKTQTRRVIRPCDTDCRWPMYPSYSNGVRDGSSSNPHFDDLTAENGGQPLFSGNTPFCPGDRLYVREAWRVPAQDDEIAPRDLDRQIVGYEADCVAGQISSTGKFRQAMHMPRWASRLTLPVTDVRVQRLQEICEADALAEGISPLPTGRYHCGYDDDGEITCKSPITAYGWLWNSLNEDRGFGWASNPWIVAVSFTVEHRNIDAPSPTGGGHG